MQRDRACGFSQTQTTQARLPIGGLCQGVLGFVEGYTSWFSRTTEAEYVSLADVLKEVLFLRQVWRLFDVARMPVSHGIPVDVFQCMHVRIGGYLAGAESDEQQQFQAHLRKAPLIRDLVGRKEMSVFHVESAYQHMDLTKALHVGDLEFHRYFVTSMG